MKLDLTDMGLRIVSWSNKGTTVTLDPTELHEKTSALVDALKAVEAAADATPSKLRDLVSLRVEVMGQTVIGEAPALFVVLDTVEYETADSFVDAFTDEGAAIEHCRKNHASRVVLAAMDDPEADWLEVWPHDQRPAGGEG